MDGSRKLLKYGAEGRGEAREGGGEGRGEGSMGTGERSERGKKAGWRRQVADGTGGLEGGDTSFWGMTGYEVG